VTLAVDAADRRRELAAILADPAAFRHWYETAVVVVYRYLYTRCAGDPSVVVSRR